MNRQHFQAKHGLALVAGVLLLGHLPLVLLHFRGLWQQEQYQYFPFVIGAIAWLLWSRWQEGESRLARSYRFASLPWLFVGSGLFMLAGSILMVSPWLAYVALVMALTAVFVWIDRQRKVEYLWGIWLLLWLMVPPPLGADDKLVRSLQRLSSQLSSTILDYLGVLHVMAGNVLQLPEKEFFVDEACSGIVSVMSVIACAAIYSVWRNRSLVHLLLLAGAGIVWALVLNVVRITAIAIAFHYDGLDLSSGTVHEILGLVLFLLVFLALVSTDFLLMALLAPIDTGLLGEASERNWLVRQWNRGSLWNAADYEAEWLEKVGPNETASAGAESFGWGKVALLAVPCLLLGLVQLLRMPSVDTQEAKRSLERALALDETSLPAQLGPWMRESFEAVEREAYSDFGKYSRTFVYRHSKQPNVTATVSLDFPYLGGWHDLCVCYRNTDWTIEGRETAQSHDSATQRWNYVRAELLDPTEAHARVMYAGFDAHGQSAEPPGDAVLFRPWFRLRRRLLLHLAPQLYQVQVFSPVGSFENQELEESLGELLTQAATRFQAEVTGHLTAGE